MKIALLLVLLTFSPPASGQNSPSSAAKESVSPTDQIRADRTKADAREESDSKKRPWDRDINGKRPWDQKYVPLPNE
jgi:hypothetical protein